MIWVLWQGGPSYRTSSVHDGDLETFAHFADAADALVDRYWNRDGQTPAVGDDTRMEVFLEEPDPLDGNPTPDSVILLAKSKDAVYIRRVIA